MIMPTYFHQTQFDIMKEIEKFKQDKQKKKFDETCREKSFEKKKKKILIIIKYYIIIIKYYII